MITKSQLRIGDIVWIALGRKYFLNTENVFIRENNCWLSGLNSYNEDLTRNDKHPEFDIIRVFRHPNGYQILKNSGLLLPEILRNPHGYGFYEPPSLYSCFINLQQLTNIKY